MTKPNATVSVGNTLFANDAPLSLIAGPCQFESRRMPSTWPASSRN